MRNLLIALFLLVCSHARAQLPWHTLTLPELMKADITVKGQFRWVKIVDGNYVNIHIADGVASRTNPGMGSDSTRLPYDLAKHRALSKSVKDAKLSGGTAAMPKTTADRSLEIWVEGPRDWLPIARITRPLKWWKKTHPEIVAELEPLFDVQQETFQPTKER